MCVRRGEKKRIYYKHIKSIRACLQENIQLTSWHCVRIFSFRIVVFPNCIYL